MTAHRRKTWDSSRLRIQALVVAVMLVLLAGLILTVVVRVRQEAARMMCMNQLNQFSLGLLSYTDVHDRLPPLVDQGDGSPTGRGLPSVYWTLIPYLESTWRLYDPNSPDRSSVERYHAHSSTSFTFQAKMEAVTQHGGDVNHPWKLFLCPSDATADQLRDVPITLPDGSTGYYATGSYAVNGMAPWGGKFQWGASELILFAERPQVCRTASGDTVHNLWGVGFYSSRMPAFATLTPTEPAGLWSTGQIAPVVPLPDHDDEVRVRIGWANAEPQVPDFATPVQRIRTDRSCDPRLPGALHLNGMNTMMADGSVRTFRYDTTPWVFWAACVPSEKR